MKTIRLLLCALAFSLICGASAQAGSFPANISNLEQFLATYLDKDATLVEADAVSFLSGPAGATGFFTPLAYETGLTNDFGMFMGLTESGYDMFIPFFSNQNLGSGSLAFVTNEDAMMLEDLSQSYGFSTAENGMYAVMPNLFPDQAAAEPQNTIQYWSIPANSRLYVPGAIDMIFTGNSYIFGFNDSELDGDFDDFIMAFSDSNSLTAPVPLPAGVYLLGAGMLIFVRRRV